jgi:anti-sigma factor RsiW
MREKFNPADESDEARKPLCERGEDLVAYLYKEASPHEARSFEQHARDCAACREELAAFGAVRRSIDAWRTDALSITPTLALDSHAARATRFARKRSALAAIREFFALSPAWLRVGAPAAVALVCALTILTLARAEVRWDADGFAFRTGARAERVSTQTVEVVAPDTFTRAQVEEMLRAEAQRARDEVREQLSMGDSMSPTVVPASDVRDSRQRSLPNYDAPRAARRTDAAKRSHAMRRQQQARAEDEDDTTSLYDLLRVVN